MKLSADNELTVNLTEVKDIVFHKPNPMNYLPPVELNEIERVGIVQLLGVWLQNNMSAGKQVEYITRICNQRLYFLNQMRKYGLPQAQLHNVFQAIIMFFIQYSSSARYGYASKVHIQIIQKMLWYIVVNKDFRIVDLFDDSETLL